MDFVPIDLAGRTYRIRYTPDDIQDICRRLTTFQPVGGGKVTPVVLGNLLLNLDPDAIQFCLWAGLKHIREFKDLDPPGAQQIIREAVKRGAQYTDFRRPIFKALVACGLADFGPIVKILEDTEAQQAQDGAVDVPAEEADPGNGSRPSSTSLMRTSMPSSVTAGSDS